VGGVGAWWAGYGIVIHVINVMAVRIEGCQVFHESSFGAGRRLNGILLPDQRTKKTAWDVIYMTLYYLMKNTKF
jgi:hypothetical protein